MTPRSTVQARCRRVVLATTTALIALWLVPVLPAHSAEPASSVVPVMRAAFDPISGQVDVTESGTPVLRYNYLTVIPGTLTNQVRPDDLKYAQPRSDYIHPLFGLDGEELTRDWSRDHPHHRGIYWAWPEVTYQDQLGDLHALQRVFARPTGRCQLHSGSTFAEIDAENLWLWEDRDAIVRERALIRVHRASQSGRFIDLEFQFTALRAGVSLARRGTDKYGGLNIRLAPVQEQQITFHTDPTNTSPRRAWADLSGLFQGASTTSGLTVLPWRGNEHYPGDWVQFPELNWFQPTFPTAGTRYALSPERPLVLRYRLWIHRGGTPSDEVCASRWDDYQNTSSF